ncbi:MAG: hypothetical protein M9933_12115 [Chitinophagaceae bacterium]|nr:hypothetical protein [Chitinophagaceae bacterium]
MTLLHQSRYFAIYQCDTKRCFYLRTEYKSVSLTLCQLLNFRNKVLQMDLAAHFDENRNPSGIEILIFCNCEHLIILDTYQVIDLKHFIRDAFGKLRQPSHSLA